MNPLRHFLLVMLLCFAQLAAGGHAIEHGAANDEGLPTHACPLCLTAHDLGAALPGLAVLPLAVAVHAAPEIRPMSGRSALPALAARQGAPPLA